MAAPRTLRGLQFCVLFSCVLITFSFTDDDFDIASDSVLTVEHTFDSGSEAVFTQGGTVTVQSIKAAVADYKHERPLTEEEKNKLKNLVETNGDYRIRVSTRAVDGSLQHVSSFVKACALYESRLRGRLTVHVDQSANVLGVALTVASPYCLGLSVDDEDLSDFHLTVDVLQTIPGPAPETQSYVEKLEQERTEKAKGQPADTKSFFGKYWMYIVPVVIFMMFAQSQDSGGGAAAGGGGR